MVPLYTFTYLVTKGEGEPLGGNTLDLYWDLTIIYPRSFQIGNLLKVNCSGQLLSLPPANDGALLDNGIEWLNQNISPTILVMAPHSQGHSSV